MKTLGIDYGLGRSNVDPATGIRYGVISQHSLASWFFDDYQGEYGDPHCPKCGNPAVDVTSKGADYLETIEEYDQDRGCTDYACDSCRYVFDSSEAFPDEPLGFKLEDDDYTAVDCLDSDVMILRSPYYTYAPFCSPCVPGAGNLDDSEGHTSENGVKTFCFSHDLFEDRRAPYRVFRVEDDSEVLPDITLYCGLSGAPIVRVPPEAIDDCAHVGPCDDDVKHWITRVEWLATREDLARMLRESGAWEDLDTADLETLRSRALWSLCCDEREEWRSK